MRTIMGKTGMLLAIVTIGLACAMPALAANVSGVVTAPGGKGVAGIKVIAMNPKGTTISSAISSADGKYTLGLHPDANYRFALDTGMTGFEKGSPVGAFVPRSGLTLNWVVSPNARPLAYARPASAGQVAAADPPADPPGVRWAELALGGGFVAAGTIGGYGAAGGFDGGSSSHIASSSK